MDIETLCRIDRTLAFCTGYKLNAERNNCTQVFFLHFYLSLLGALLYLHNSITQFQIATFHVSFINIICIECEKEFPGENCDTKCPYPTYKEGCRSLCNCNITNCDHLIGCTVFQEVKSHYKWVKTFVKSICQNDLLRYFYI